VVVLLTLAALTLAAAQSSPAPHAPAGEKPLAAERGREVPRGSGTNAPGTEAPVPLAFGEIFAPGSELALSEEVRSLRGRRVRMEGYAAQMEDAPAGAFWLVPLPVKGDESGAGVGDLPPASVLVVVRSAGEQPVRPAAKGLVSVTGLLEVGHVEAGGQSSLLRIVLDRAPVRPPAKPSRTIRNARTSRAPAAP
jgi:hypothetical protein